MLRDIALLAVDKAAYNEALNGFLEHKVVGLIACMVGSGIAIYPWMAFAPIK